MIVAIEGVGKSTLVTALAAHYPRSTTFHYPRADAPLTGPLFATPEFASAPGRVQTLLFRANRVEAPLPVELCDDEIVLVDRHFWSGIAYAVARGEHAGSVMLSELQAIESLRKPDFTICVKGDAQGAAESAVDADTELQERVWQAYEMLLEADPDDSVAIPNGPNLVPDAIAAIDARRA